MILDFFHTPFNYTKKYSYLKNHLNFVDRPNGGILENMNVHDLCV